MTSETTVDVELLGGWTAQDWDDLAEKWSALIPPPGDDGTGFIPRLDGRPLTPRQAGLVFERWILESFRLDGADVRPSFSVPMSSSERTMEQIDGLVYFGWQAFLIESKNWGESVDFTPIALLHERTQRRPPGTLGLVFSSSSFTMPALEASALIRPLSVLLFDRRDLEFVVRERNMVKALQAKWLLAVTYGRPDSAVWEWENGGDEDAGE